MSWLEGSKSEESEIGWGDVGSSPWARLRPRLPQPRVKIPAWVEGWEDPGAWEATDCAIRESLMVSKRSKVLDTNCIRILNWVETVSLEPLISFLKKSNLLSKTPRSLAVSVDRLVTSVMSSCSWGWAKANTCLCKSRTLPVSLRIYPSSSSSHTDWAVSI